MTSGYNWNLSSLSNGHQLCQLHRRSYDSAAAASDPTISPPTVSSRWTSRFLERHPEFYIRKQKHSSDSARRHTALAISSLGLNGIKLFVTRMLSNLPKNADRNLGTVSKLVPTFVESLASCAINLHRTTFYYYLLLFCSRF